MVSLFNCGIDPNLEMKLWLLKCVCSLLLHCAVALELFHLSLPQVFVVKKPMGSNIRLATHRSWFGEEAVDFILVVPVNKGGKCSSSPLTVFSGYFFFLLLRDKNTVPITYTSDRERLYI